MSEHTKRKIATFDKQLTPAQVEEEKRRNTTLGKALKKADKQEQQNR